MYVHPKHLASRRMNVLLDHVVHYRRRQNEVTAAAAAKEAKRAAAQATALRASGDAITHRNKLSRFASSLLLRSSVSSGLGRALTRDRREDGRTPAAAGNAAAARSALSKGLSHGLSTLSEVSSEQSEAAATRIQALARGRRARRAPSADTRARLRATYRIA